MNFPTVAMVFVTIVTLVSHAHAQSELLAIARAASAVKDCDASLHFVDVPKLLETLEQGGYFTATGESADLLERIAEGDDVTRKSIEELQQLVQLAPSIETLHIFLRTERSGGSGTEFLLLADSKEIKKNHLTVLQTTFRTAVEESGQPGIDATLSVQEGDGYVLLSNSVSWLEDARGPSGTLARLEKSYFSDRAFQRSFVAAQESRNSLAYVFFRPEAFESFFRKSVREESPVMNLPSGWLAINLQSNKPRISIVGSVLHKFPVEGRAELWDATAPVSDFPEFCFELVEASLYGWDPEKLWAAKCRDYDRTHGEGAYAKLLETRYAASGLPANNNVAHADLVAAYRYRNKLGVVKFLVAERIYDPEVMNQILEYHLEKDKERGFCVLKETVQFRLLGFPGSQMEKERAEFITSVKRTKHLWLEYERRYPRGEMDDEAWLKHVASVGVENKGYLVLDGWVYYGAVEDLQVIADYHAGKEAQKDYSASLEEFLEKRSLSQTGLGAEPFSINFDDEVNLFTEGDTRRPRRRFTSIGELRFRLMARELSPEERAMQRERLVCLYVEEVLRCFESKFQNRLILHSKSLGSSLRFYVELFSSNDSPLVKR